MKRLSNIFRTQVVFLHGSKNIADYFRSRFLFEFIGITLQSSNFFFYFGDGVQFFSHAFLMVFSQLTKLRGGFSNAEIGQTYTAWLIFIF